MNPLESHDPVHVALTGVAFILIVLISYYYLVLTGPTTYKGRRTLPYAPGGMFETFANLSGEKSSQYMVQTSRDIQANHGIKSFRLNLPMGGKGVYVVTDASLCKKILQEPKALKGDFYGSFAALGGTKDNIFSSETNDSWAFSRKALRHAFSNKEVSRMMAIAKDVADKWLLDMEDKVGDVFDPSEEMVKLTFRVICKAAFEYDCSDDEFRTFGNNAKIALEEFEFGSANPIRNVLWFLFPGARKARACAAELQAFGKRVLEHYRSLKPEERSTSNTLIKLIAENDGFPSDAQRIAEIVIFMIAGHDTTGYTLGSTLVLLAEHPEVAKKLQTEVAKYSPEEWKSCDYLKWTIRESIRMMPVASVGPIRVTSKDYMIGKDWIIPEGATAILPQIAAYHDEDMFENADKFQPERWENATDEQKAAFMPFAMGKRNCVGQSLATSELESVLPAIMQKFDLELVNRGEPVTILTMKFDGSKLKLKRR